MALSPGSKALLATAVAALIHDTRTMPTPRRMDSDTTPRDVCEAFDVYFNGIRQLCCKVADVDKGYIVRYKRSVGRKPVGTETEVLRGKVEIRRKGEPRQTGQADPHSSARPLGSSETSDCGAGAGAPCDPATDQGSTP